jgi:hypothetical protein
VIKVGSHVVKTWSRTQKAVALSSGEAEVIALVMGVSEAIGIQRMAETWGVKYGIVGLCDSTAAMGICERKGGWKNTALGCGNDVDTRLESGWWSDGEEGERGRKTQRTS